MLYLNSLAGPGKRMAALALLLVWPILSLPLPQGAAQSAIPLRANGQIAFTSDRDGNREIYVMNADGTNQVRITNNAVVDDYPTWSPDGTKIAFICERPTGGFAICLMNGDGANKTEITPINYHVYESRQMSWSPDGNRIVFADYVAESPYNGDFFVVNVDGSNRQNLNLSSGGDPSWSPDGSKILFSNGWLYTIKPDGTGLQALPIGLADGFGDYSPQWSPSGDKIVFVVDVWDFVYNIFIANADGTNRQFFDGCDWFDSGCRRNHLSPAWSPDGTKIVYTITQKNGGGGSIQIYVKNVDGTGFAQLTNTPAGNFNPSWQPLPVRVIPRRPWLPREPIIRQ